MTEDKLHIKNMVCRRCVMTVEDICRDLGIRGATVELGSVAFSTAPDAGTLDLFADRLRAVGFEPLKSHDLVMMEKIKAAVRHYARHAASDAKDRLSAHIERALNIDFRHASRLFSSLEGRTIQGYLMSQRVEYVKELLFDDELTLAEIADRVGFSSVAHLSRAFKKSQGITISDFRSEGMRLGIDEV